MAHDPTTLQDWKPTLIAAMGLVMLSALAWYILSPLTESAAGDTIGAAATIGLAIWLFSQTWYYMALVR